MFLEDASKTNGSQALFLLHVHTASIESNGCCRKFLPIRVAEHDCSVTPSDSVTFVYQFLDWTSHQGVGSCNVPPWLSLAHVVGK